MRFFSVAASTTLILMGYVLPLSADGEEAFSDASIKDRYVFASRCQHMEDSRNHYEYAFLMAGNDTNRFASVLRDLAVENTNQTEYVIRSLGRYKTPESLPFLHSYATNLIYGVDAVKSIFAIEGVNTNSFSALESYLSITNRIPNSVSHDRSELCKDFLSNVFADSALVTFRQPSLDMMLDFAKYRNTGHVVIDGALQAVDPSYRYSKRRLQVMRLSMERCLNSFHTNYISNVINELVAYPESELPD